MLYFIRFQFAPRPTDRPPRPTASSKRASPSTTTTPGTREARDERHAEKDSRFFAQNARRCPRQGEKTDRHRRHGAEHHLPRSGDARRVRDRKQNVRRVEVFRDDVVDVFRVLRRMGVEHRARGAVVHEGERVRVHIIW